MKIKTVEYSGSFGFGQTFPAPRGPEFVFVGRSNVGKSSLINTLVGRRNIARTSNTPGKTRTVNFYTINDAFRFVDIPGHGYAKVSQTERAKWRKLIAAYLEGRESLAGVVQLLDIRHAPSREDQAASRQLHESGKSVCVVFNKIDKVAAGDVRRRIVSYLSALTVSPETAVVPFSAETGQGKRALWEWISERLSH